MEIFHTVLLLAIIGLLAIIIRKVNKTMTAQEVHDAVLVAAQGVKDHLDQAAARVTAALDALNASVADLKTQLAAAGTPADFSDVEAKLADVQTEADGIAPAPVA